MKSYFLCNNFGGLWLQSMQARIPIEIPMHFPFECICMSQSQYNDFSFYIIPNTK